MEDIKFQVTKNILWDNWGQICKGKGRLDDKGSLIYASAESLYYPGISDSIPGALIKLLETQE
ncbi:hypothetical protein [Metabacillus fastidiosus]|uniref:hypothetical protein n=1 Tax=Metabacillus fastidiosus TaxID=1458 RepID=UPI003D27E561